METAVNMNILAECAMTGNARALAELLELSWQPLYRYLHGLILDPHDTQDVVQETLIRAVDHLERYDSSKSVFTTWLCAIGRNVWFDELRRRNRAKKYWGLAVGEIKDDLVFSETDFDNSAVMDALRRLEPDVRTAIVLKYCHGYTQEEIGRMMGIKVGTVKSRIYYGVVKMRKELVSDAEE